MALRIAPSSAYRTETSNYSQPSLSTPSVPGLADPLRRHYTSAEGTAPQNVAAMQPSSSHALEARLLHWRQNQGSLKMEGLRRTFGIAEPVRRGMELDMVKAGEWRAQSLGGSAGVSSEILEGRDSNCDWEDIFIGNQSHMPAEIQSEMESKLRMHW